MPLINNPSTVTMLPSGGPLLDSVQLALLQGILAAYARDRSQFYVARTMGGTTITHSAFDEERPCEYADVVALERTGTINVVSRGRGGDGISAFAPTALAAALAHPDDYVDLSDEAWAIARDTLRNRPERVRDVQRMLRGICDDVDAPDTIKDTAQAADLLLGHVERYLDPGNPADEPLARASTASLRALAVTIMRVGGPPLAMKIAEAVLEAFNG